MIVTQAGYTPFDGEKSFDSDYRMLWVELDNTSILGKTLPCQSPTLTEKIQSNHPGIRKAYQTKISQHGLRLNVGHKSRDLQQLLHRFYTGEHQLYNQIVNDYNCLHSTAQQASNSVSKTFIVLCTEGMYHGRLQFRY